MEGFVKTINLGQIILMLVKISPSKLLAAMGFLIALCGIYGIRERFKQSANPRGMDQVLSQDLALLEKGNDESPEYYQAILRLAKYQREAVQKEIKSLLESQKEEDSAIGLEALGYEGDSAENLERFALCLEKKGPSQRLLDACLNGLGHNQSEKRELMLESWVGNWNKTESPPWRAVESLLNVTADATKKEKIVENIKTWIQEKPTKNVYVPFLLLVRWASADESVRRLALNFIETSPDQSLQKVAVNYLAQMEDPEIQKRLSHYLTSSNERVKLLMLGSIHSICPPDRLKIIAEFMAQEENRKYLPEVLDELSFLGEAGAGLVLDQARNNSFWSQQDASRIDDAVAKMKSEFRREKSACRLRDH